MKTTVITTSCVAFVLGLLSTAHAQLIAGSPEDKAFTKIEQEGNLDTKIGLLLDFEKQFPQSKALVEVYKLLAGAYEQKNDLVKTVEAGEKALKIDPENVDVLLKVAVNLGKQGRDLDKAVAYAQKAVDTLAKNKTAPPPLQYTDAQWKQRNADLEPYAKQILAYVQRLKP